MARQAITACRAITELQRTVTATAVGIITVGITVGTIAAGNSDQSEQNICAPEIGGLA